VDIKFITDPKGGYKFEEACDKLTDYCRENRIKTNNSNLIVVFSNDWEFIKEISEKYLKPRIIINVTENLSEHHVCHTLKYVSDICYLKTDVNIIATRIIKSYNRNYNSKKERINA